MNQTASGLCSEGFVDSSTLLTELLDLLETDTIWSPGSRTSIVKSYHLSAHYSSASDTESIGSDFSRLSVKTDSLVLGEETCLGDPREEFVEAIESNQNFKDEVDREPANKISSQAALDAHEGSSALVASSGRLTLPRPVDTLLSFDLPSTVSSFNLPSSISQSAPSEPSLSPAKTRSWPRSGFSSRLKTPLAQIFKKRPSSDQL